MVTVFLKYFKNAPLVLHFFVCEKFIFNKNYSTMMLFTSHLSAPGPALIFLMSS